MQCRLFRDVDYVTLLELVGHTYAPASVRRVAGIVLRCVAVNLLTLLGYDFHILLTGIFHHGEIRRVSHGLSNKEIADKLCLSFHTITTYRKNITSKLNLHSSAALIIFAILNKIVDPKEIELK